MILNFETLKTSLINQQWPSDDKQHRFGRQAVR